jgi:uncharacterized protein (UPF0303 family)
MEGTDYAALVPALEAQEAELQFSSFSNDDALALGLAIVARAKESGAAIAVDIRRGEQQLFHAALAGSSVDNDQWILRKSRLAARFGRSSFLIGTKLRRDGQTLEGKYMIGSPEYSAHGGAFPLLLRGTGCVGTIAVSGLPQEEDHALVVQSIRAYIAAKTGKA